MNRTKLTITIDTEKELTEEQIVEAIVNFKFRLEGYHTESLEFLKNADISIDKHYKMSTLP